MLIPLTVPEIRRRVLALREPEARRSFRQDWSQWRRGHQAVAARCRAAKRARRLRWPAATLGQADPRARSTAAATVLPAVVRRPLTDAEWQRILPLLPPQRPRVGRPRHDHRTVLTGILSVLCSGASWREMPREYGKWETAYRRYRLWQDDGRFQGILTALDLPAPRPPPR